MADNLYFLKKSYQLSKILDEIDELYTFREALLVENNDITRIKKNIKELLNEIIVIKDCFGIEEASDKIIEYDYIMAHYKHLRKARNKHESIIDIDEILINKNEEFHTENNKFNQEVDWEFDNLSTLLEKFTL